MKEIENDLIRINSAIHHNHVEIKNERKDTAKELKKMLGKRYSINVRNKDTLDFKKYLKSEFGKQLKIDDQILKLGQISYFKSS